MKFPGIYLIYFYDSYAYKLFGVSLVPLIESCTTNSEDFPHPKTPLFILMDNNTQTSQQCINVCGNKVINLFIISFNKVISHHAYVILRKLTVSDYVSI